MGRSVRKAFGALASGTRHLEVYVPRLAGTERTPTALSITLGTREAPTPVSITGETIQHSWCNDLDLSVTLFEWAAR